MSEGTIPNTPVGLLFILEKSSTFASSIELLSVSANSMFLVIQENDSMYSDIGC